MNIPALDGRTVFVLVLLVVLFAGACGERPAPLDGRQASGGGDQGTTGTSEELPRIGPPPPCDDTGLCAAGFMVDDRFYSLSCGGVRPEVVSQEVLAEGDLHGDDVELRRIQSVDPHVLVAISVAGGQCTEGESVLSPWSMAFPGELSGEEVREAICHAAVEEHRARNGCS